MKHCPLVLASFLAFALASCGPTSATSNPGSSPAAGGNSSNPPSELTSLSLPDETSYPDADTTKLGAKQRTFYQLLIYSFADGNGDGVGDFKGIIDHLDYLENLGIGGIWLSPALSADSYHAYDVNDYYKINSTYEVTVGGTKYDFAKLLDACHAKGIKVLLDLVLNHSSSNCSWYKDHPSWYKTPDAFGGSMKDFNYDNQELRAEIKNVGKYWLQKGVDGFRLDAAKWIYNYGGVTDSADDTKNYAWWKEFYTYCQGVKSDVYMIGEVLVENNIKDDRRYYQTGMDSNFNFEMRDVVYDAARYASPNNYINLLENFQTEIRGYNPKAIEASCLSNHDIGRFYNFNGASYSEAQLALAGFLNILAPGDSYVYYGEEIGLEGTASGWTDMNYRTPMMFESGKTNPEKYFYGVPSKAASSSTKSGKTADAQAKAKDSLYAAYAKAIQAKNRNPILYSGAVAKGGNGGNSEIGSFVVTEAGKSLTVVFNCGPSQKQITMDGSLGLVGESAFSGYSAVSGKILAMPAYSVAILDGKPTLVSVASDGTVPSESAPVEPTITATPDAFGSKVTAEKSGKLTLHCYDTANWGSMKCYAWVDGGSTYLGGWPGAAMTKEEGNWFKIEIDHGASNVIFNNGSSQTVDLYRPEAGEYWFYPKKGGDKMSGDWYKVNPLA